LSSIVPDYTIALTSVPGVYDCRLGESLGWQSVTPVGAGLVSMSAGSFDVFPYGKRGSTLSLDKVCMRERALRVMSGFLCQSVPVSVCSIGVLPVPSDESRDTVVLCDELLDSHARVPVAALRRSWFGFQFGSGLDAVVAGRDVPVLGAAPLEVASSSLRRLHEFGCHTFVRLAGVTYAYPRVGSKPEVALPEPVGFDDAYVSAGHMERAVACALSLFDFVDRVEVALPSASAYPVGNVARMVRAWCDSTSKIFFSAAGCW
jgi:hypothetical protein